MSVMSPSVQRVLVGLVLLVAGVFSLPLAAAILDGPSTENLILPAQLLAMIVLGGGLAAAVPAFVGPDVALGRRVLVGGAGGLGAALLGVAIFWLLLNGLSGA